MAALGTALPPPPPGLTRVGFPGILTEWFPSVSWELVCLHPSRNRFGPRRENKLDIYVYVRVVGGSVCSQVRVTS